MKKINTLAILIICLPLSASAQQFFKLKVGNKVSKTTPKPKSDTIHKDSVKPPTVVVTPSIVLPSGTAATANKRDTAATLGTEDGCAKVSSMELDVKKNVDGTYTFALNDNNGNPLATFSIASFSKALYESKITAAVNSICSDQTKIGDAIKQLSSDSTYQNILEEATKSPSADVIAGSLMITKYVTLFQELNQPNKFAVKPHSKYDDSVGKFAVYTMKIQFQDGFIENISIDGKLDKNKNLLKFENTFPIAFSVKRNFNDLIDVPLYETTYYKNDDNRKYIFIGDVLRYEPNYQLNTKDYFPDNQVYNSVVTDTITTLNLNKENTSQILAVQVFSDLKGASSNSPNGLIQVNLGKKLNLYTRRYYWNTIKGDIGWLNYFTPEFTLSKIENNLKYLVLNFSGGAPNAPTNPNVYTTTLNLLLYQEFQIGGKFNLFLLDAPSLKSTFYLNVSGRFGRTAIQDTTRVYDATKNTFSPAPTNNLLQYGANSFQMIPEAQWTINPDQRYSIAVTQQFNNYRLLTEQFKQIDDIQRYNTYLNNKNFSTPYYYQKWIGTSEIVGTFTPTAANQIFLRYRYNWDLGNAKNNFNQIQIGVTTYLTTSNITAAK